MKEFILAQDGIVIYVTLFLALIGGALGLPIPEDLPLIAGGIAIHERMIHPALAFVVCYSAIITGDMFIFAIGRHFGPRLFASRWFRKKSAQRKIKSVRLGLERRSLPMIFIARHLFYLRTVTFLTCGAVKMKWHRFLMADAASALVSVPLMLGLGYLAAGQYDSVMTWIRRFEWASLVIGVITITVFSIVLVRRRKTSSAPDPTDRNL